MIAKAHIYECIISAPEAFVVHLKVIQVGSYSLALPGHKTALLRLSHTPCDLGIFSPKLDPRRLLEVVKRLNMHAYTPWSHLVAWGPM